jgi:hypothetical protein
VTSTSFVISVGSLRNSFSIMSLPRHTALINSYEYLGLIQDDNVGMRAIKCSEEVNDSTVLKYDKMLTAISCITVSGTSVVFSER